MKLRLLALPVAAAAVALVLPTSPAFSAGGQHPTEAGCYDILSGDNGGSAAGLSQILQSATLDATAPGGVRKTYYPNALAVQGVIKLAAAPSPGGITCDGARYSVLVYHMGNSVSTPTWSLEDRAGIAGNGTDTVTPTALVDSLPDEYVGVRLEVQDPSGAIIDDAPDTKLAPVIFCNPSYTDYTNCPPPAQGFTG